MVAYFLKKIKRGNIIESNSWRINRKTRKIPISSGSKKNVEVNGIYQQVELKKMKLF